jgi:hypothetical protein
MNEGRWNDEGFWEWGANLESEEEPVEEKAYAEASFSIKCNNAVVNDPCAVCGRRTDPEFGPELFLRDSWALVCYVCGAKYAPELMECLQSYRAGREFDEFLGDAPRSVGRIDDVPEENESTPKARHLRVIEGQSVDQAEEWPF